MRNEKEEGFSRGDNGRRKIREGEWEGERREEGREGKRKAIERKKEEIRGWN